MQTNTISIKRFFINYLKTLVGLTLVCAFILVVLFYASPTYFEKISDHNTINQLLIYLAIGFVAQMIDGSLGMAYGITCTSSLISSGVPPVLASASVHIAEVFTTASSGFFHWKLGNVDRKLFIKLALPGALGAIIGAFLLSSFDGEIIKPYISAYLIIMGFVVITKAFRTVVLKEPKKVGFLALFGGFVDASGGGGWGPIVTTTLLARGNNPTKTIGTVNAVEFVVAFCASGIFTIFVGIQNLEIIIGLIVGGLLASPFGAIIANRINRRWSMVVVGSLIILLSLRTILKTFGYWF